jgi:hypothetical protein
MAALAEVGVDCNYLKQFYRPDYELTDPHYPPYGSRATRL